MKKWLEKRLKCLQRKMALSNLVGGQEAKRVVTVRKEEKISTRQVGAERAQNEVQR